MSATIAEFGSVILARFGEPELLYQIYEEGTNFASRQGFKGKVSELVGVLRILLGFYWETRIS